MCVTCGCRRPKDDHGDPRNLTRKDFHRAAKAADLDMHHVVANINQAYTEGLLSKGVPKPDEGKLAPYIAGENPAWSAHAEPSERQSFEFLTVRKQVEQRYTLGVAYAPGPDPKRGADGYRDTIAPEELEKAAWSFMEHPQVGLFHDKTKRGTGRVVESYVYRGPTWTIGDATIEPGTWLLGVIWDPDAWALVKSGKVRGFSIDGTASRRPLGEL